jgi:hypothetical protein
MIVNRPKPVFQTPVNDIEYQYNCDAQQNIGDDIAKVTGYEPSIILGKK